MNKKIRIGVLIGSSKIPAWAFRMLQRIEANHNLEIVLSIRDNKNLEDSKITIKKVWFNRHRLLWILYNKLENKLFNPQPNALAFKEIDDVLKCETLIMSRKEVSGQNNFTIEDIHKIRSHDLDVVINLCSDQLNGELLSVSKYGIWSYAHGDKSINRGGSPGTWEVFKGQDEIGIALDIVSDKFDGVLKSKISYSATEKLSIKRTNNKSYMKALSLLPRKLDELYKLGDIAFFEKLMDENSAPKFFDNKMLSDPSNIEVICAFYRIYAAKILDSIKSHFYFGQWMLLFKFEKENKWSTSFNEFIRILPPKDRFWADPFIWVKDGKYYIFLEELIYKENVGKIAVMEIDENGNYGRPEIVLDKPYHLSYPFLIEENEELFMIPETAKNGTIELYRCVNFPLKWELHKVLMKDVYAVDSTILKHDGKYWLFCNIRENEGASSLDELFLFYSDSLMNENWKGHPCNPIISDVSSSRPAGNIFESNGKLFRPSQNSARGYGHGLKINEIIELTTTSYKEETLQSLYPIWEKDLISTHTINHNNRLTVIDAMIKKRR